MKKKILKMVLCIMMAGSLAACGSQKEAPAETPVVESAETGETATGETATGEGSQEPCVVRAIVPSTDSQYWNINIGYGIQNAILDAEAAYGIDIDYELIGPATEAETDKYMSLLENAISQKPDILIISTIMPDSTAPLVSEATSQGIRVYLNMDPVETIPQEDYVSRFSNKNSEMGEKGALAFIEQIKEKGITPEGYVSVHMGGVNPELEKRLTTFKEVLNAEYPEIEVLDTAYNDNDVNRGIAQAEANLSTYGDKLIGFFGGNNTSGVAIARCVEASGRDTNTLVSVSVDADDVAVEALRVGNLDALILQPSYSSIYKLTTQAMDTWVNGTEYPKEETGTSNVVTRSNIDNLDETTKSDLSPQDLKR
mgnify:FL=1